MKKILAKILAFIRSLFYKTPRVLAVVAPVVVPVTPPVAAPCCAPVAAPVAAPVVKPPKEVDYSQNEPEISSSAGTITSFLWKPESDTAPKGSVISVSSDTLRAKDVRVYIKDKDGKEIKINNKFNAGGELRGNRLPNHKYGRFNFKPGGNADNFTKHAPLSVSFAVIIDGKTTPLKVMGKDVVVVKDPKKRVDLR